MTVFYELNYCPVQSDCILFQMKMKAISPECPYSANLYINIIRYIGICLFCKTSASLSSLNYTVKRAAYCVHV